MRNETTQTTHNVIKHIYTCILKYINKPNNKQTKQKKHKHYKNPKQNKATQTNNKRNKNRTTANKKKQSIIKT